MRACGAAGGTYAPTQRSSPPVVTPQVVNVPTAIEQGYPGMSADNWYAIVVPAGTPQPVVAKLHAAALQATNAPEVKEKLAKIGSETFPMASPAEFPPFLKRELDRWGAVVKAAGLEKK